MGRGVLTLGRDPPLPRPTRSPEERHNETLTKNENQPNDGVEEKLERILYCLYLGASSVSFLSTRLTLFTAC